MPAARMLAIDGDRCARGRCVVAGTRDHAPRARRQGRDRERAVCAGDDGVAIRIDDRQRLGGTRRDDACVRDRRAASRRRRARRARRRVRATARHARRYRGCPTCRASSRPARSRSRVRRAATIRHRCPVSVATPSAFVVAFQVSVENQERSSTSAPATGAPPAAVGDGDLDSASLAHAQRDRLGRCRTAARRAGPAYAITRGRLDAVVATGAGPRRRSRRRSRSRRPSAGSRRSRPSRARPAHRARR